MSISDLIVVMKDGVVHQIGKPQEVYNNPVNLFVAKFLGTPPINLFDGKIQDEMLYIGEEAVLPAKGQPNREKVYVGVRPEGFVPDANGALGCKLINVEVMGRDVSVVSSNAAMLGASIRSIVDADNVVDTANDEVRFSLKPHKVLVFDYDTEERIRIEE